MTNQELNDEELDGLLRQVETPHDLKDRLRQIPNSQSELTRVQPAEKTASRSWLIGVLAVAATLLAIAGFLSWVLPGDIDRNRSQVAKSDPAEQTDLPTTHLESDDLDPDSPADSPDSDADSVAVAHERIDLLMHEIEMSELRMKLATLTSEATYVDLDPRDTRSMVLALADLAALDHGVSEEQVTSDMQLIARDLPGSRGATIARQFLVNNFKVNKEN